MSNPDGTWNMRDPRSEQPLLPFHIFTSKENRARPPVAVWYRLVVQRDGTIESISFAYGDPTRNRKWTPLHLDDVDVYRIVVEMLAKALTGFATKVGGADPQIGEDGKRFLSVTV